MGQPVIDGRWVKILFDSSRLQIILHMAAWVIFLKYKLELQRLAIAYGIRSKF